MDKAFIDILQKLTAEQGKEALLNESKCRSLLADYTKNEYKKESRFLFQTLEAGAQKAIDTANDLSACKKQQVRLLHEEYSMDEKIAADVVNTLALVLRGDTTGTDAETVLERGMKHFDNKDFDKAFEEFNEAIRLDPNYARAYRNRGLTYMVKGQYDQAISDYSEAIRLDPNNAWAYTKRGVIYNVKGQADKAIKDFTDAIRLDPNDTEAYGGRGDAYNRKGQGDKAIGDLTKAIELNPKDAVSRMSRGQAYYDNGQRDKAITDFEKVCDMDTDEFNKEFAKNALRQIRGC